MQLVVYIIVSVMHGQADIKFEDSKSHKSYIRAFRF